MTLSVVPWKSGCDRIYIYHLLRYAYFLMFTLHVMTPSMTLPCNCDPCLHLHMIHHYATSMSICMLGGDTCYYCHVYHVPHAIDVCCVGRVMMSHYYLHMASRQYIDDILLISRFHPCDMSCALFMPTICTRAMIAMITSSTLHLHTTSLLDLIAMIACYVASPVFHSYSISWVDDIYAHASHMIYHKHESKIWAKYHQCIGERPYVNSHGTSWLSQHNKHQ